MKMELTAVKTGIIMPGGYHYKENGKMVVEEAESYVDLIQKLSTYRAVNRLPLGNPQADIDKYICTNFPNMCGLSAPTATEEGVDAVERSYGVPIKKTPRERVMQWAANRMHKAGIIEFVDFDEAKRRAEICAECPAARRWDEPVEGCPGCAVYVEEAQANLVKIRANKSTGCSISGMMCDVAGHDLETASWLEEPALRHRRNYEGQFPDHCWMKDL